MQTNARFSPWTTRSVTVKRVRNEAPSVFTYEIAFDDKEAFNSYSFKHGQFNMLYLPGIGEAAISIAGMNYERTCLLHTIRSVGAVTEKLESSGVGFAFGLRGPFGSHWPVEAMVDQSKTVDVVIVAGGVGMAPLRSLVDFIVENRNAFRHVSVLIGGRTPVDLLYQSEQEVWKSSQIDIETTVDRPTDGWNGHVGVVTLLLERLAIRDPSQTLVLTCGPEVMMRYVARSAIDRGISADNIWVTLERNMNCAIGLCGHCQFGPKFICKDGPVFRYDQVANLLRVQDL